MNPAAHPLPGYAVTEAELETVGFSPFTLRIDELPVLLAQGDGCNWSTLGDVPDAPGLYAFTVEADKIAVVYIGMTTHLWMVAKGRLPRSAGARGGQRYGRPKHAGATRQRVNLLATEQMRLGRTVRHWLRPFDVANQPNLLLRQDLLAEEERLIAMWQLRELGWNR